MNSKELESKLFESLRSLVPPGRLIYWKVWGSHSHDTALPTSDVDFCGVYVADPYAILGLSTEHPPDTIAQTKPDYQLHEVTKFCDLLMKGNPGIIEMLYTDKLEYSTPEWETIKAERKRFLSKQVVTQYLGYARGQLHKLDLGQSLHTKGGKFSEKWAYHAYRLMLDCNKILDGLWPMVWKDGGERDVLMAVRTGLLEPAFIVEQIKNLMRGAEDKLKTTDLPEHGDYDYLSKWLRGVRQESLT